MVGLSSNELIPFVYDELRKLARQRMANENPGITLSATALVHEAYCRLERNDAVPRWDNHGHFFAAAAEAMRRILIERARQKKTVKKGGSHTRVDLDSQVSYSDTDDMEKANELLSFDEALQELEREHKVVANLIKLKYYCGLTMVEAADALGFTERTAHRHWKFGKAWLYSRLHCE